MSAEEKLLKPDPAIYRRLFERFDIRPEESFFIDDIQENIDGAKACGMDGYCFADGDVESSERSLGLIRSECREDVSARQTLGLLKIYRQQSCLKKQDVL